MKTIYSQKYKQAVGGLDSPQERSWDHGLPMGETAGYAHGRDPDTSTQFEQDQGNELGGLIRHLIAVLPEKVTQDVESGVAIADLSPEQRGRLEGTYAVPRRSEDTFRVTTHRTGGNTLAYELYNESTHGSATWINTGDYGHLMGAAQKQKEESDTKTVNKPDAHGKPFSYGT